ncbi:F0F1 ATP synthase subunit B [Sphingomicrobium astaxanthinifaciens]|uniref:F0F1 ATP synthase subunit B family protein n=1 Tax=Sphingomicrobium astaxanthinifaciens TaxID=1227949 RepID=UPI001FCC9345|nr:F0F1 ATP synthase subunit B [Sphingomicrobium astaxanthinifaciens]MCJ7421945.1 F0F1 ATP synthase subunit B [Sphingomicrobium astaxanthinifaciens]
MANLPGEPVIETEVATHADADYTYFTDGAVWVAFAMIAVILLMLWKKVPSAIGKSLDAKIAAIREQLDEAKQLRAEAEALRAEYEAKAKAAQQDADAIRARAEDEAAALIDKAAADAKEMVARKKAMAEAKIAAEQRAAIAELKATAAMAARDAATSIIADKADASTDAKLIDEAITKLG